MKKGIDYFPFDVDFFEDEKIQFISARFGIKGEVCAIRLLTRIYRDGYFLKWDEDSSYLFAKVAGKEFTHGLVNDVVNELIRRGFFDKTIFDSFGILTSHGIQERFFKACERRKSVEVDQRLLLVDPADFKNLKIGMSSLSMHLNGKCKHDVDILGKNVDISTKNDNISSQSRVKESKVDIPTTTEYDETFAAVAKSYQDNIRPVMNSIESDKLMDLVETYGKSSCLKAIERAVVRGKPNLSYIAGILNSWQQHGYDEEGDALYGRTGTNSKHMHQVSRKNGGAASATKSAAIDWSKEPDTL